MTGMTMVLTLCAAVMASAALVAGMQREHPTRWRSCGFFTVFSLLVLTAELLPSALVGMAVVALLGLASSGMRPMLLRPEAQEGELLSLRRLLAPALLLPVVTILLTLLLKYLPIASVSAAHQPLLALAVAALCSWLWAVQRTRASWSEASTAGGVLLDSIGWAPVLPLFLAILGSLFQQAGVAGAVGDLAKQWLATDAAWVCLLAYGLGMAILTMLVGNAFAAFPVMIAAIGVPLLVDLHDARPGVVAAIGMLCGYCGTLLTPMAANFNLVPAALLGLDRYAVIRAQWATALPLLACNLLWIAVLGWW